MSEYGFPCAEELWWIIAKTCPEDETLWLPLIYHLADTAYIMDYLTKEWIANAVYREIELPKEACRKIVRFLALVHDIGKTTPVFQRKVLAHFPEIEKYLSESGMEVPLHFMGETETPHAHVGAVLLRNMGYPESLSVVVGAHHGKPESTTMANEYDAEIERYWRNYGGKQTGWIDAQHRLADSALRMAGYSSTDELPELSETAQMVLSGLLIMADWIASNTYYFPLISIDTNPAKYDDRRARDAIRKLNLPKPYNVADHWVYETFFRDRFGFDANNVQKTVKNVAASIEEPGIMLLEAPMGEGKTEAALAAAEIMLNRFDLGGIAFFLPSQATTNAMFSRIMTWLKDQPDADRVSVELSHSNAALNEEFAQLEKGDVQVEEDAAEPLTVHSFFRGRKTKLLADVVIGTIDQLLMAALKQKHIMLRHLGLVGKVVIIDECHAYDAYMNVYLDRILKWLGAYHVPVILLSATLPGKRRAELLTAYAGKKKCQGDQIEKSSAYPLVSFSDSTEVRMDPILYGKPERVVDIVRCTEEDMTQEIQKTLNQGGCVGIILNTVRRVQAFAARVHELFPYTEVLIDHSQFLIPDRLAHEKDIIDRVGRKSTSEQRKNVIVIGSQVLEQSLDLDFDLLVTDLCPMDLIMQRIGRLHRHNRKRPEGLEKARCVVLNCSSDNLEDGARSIYGDYLLLRTALLLPNKIILPYDISTLVQKTYDEKEGSGVFPEAYSQYNQECRKRQDSAKKFCIWTPCIDAYSSSIAGLLDNAPGFSDPQARATVRDGNCSIEVIMLREAGSGQAEILSGENKGKLIFMDRMPSIEEARQIALQRLRLPQRFSQPRCVKEVIEELERDTENTVSEWLTHPLLEGELIVFLDQQNHTRINQTLLHYDEAKGLEYKEEENAGERI